jgi:hypothetical protein
MSNVIAECSSESRRRADVGNVRKDAQRDAQGTYVTIMLWRLG